MLPLHFRISAFALVMGVGLLLSGLGTLLASPSVSATAPSEPDSAVVLPAPTPELQAPVVEKPAAVPDDAAPAEAVPAEETPAAPAPAKVILLEAVLDLPETRLPARPRSTPPPAAKPVATATTTKWIDVNLSKQTVTAYDGAKPVKTVLASTGIAVHPTIIGRFNIYYKVSSQLMTGGSRQQGDYYYLPGVPNIMYFYEGFALHGTYWHHNFGHPMSHGCVNLSLTDARWFYDWAPEGTTVVTHL